MRVYVTADREDREPGFVGDRLIEHGADLVYLDRDDLPDHADLDRADLVLLLGSARSAWADDQRSVVAAESALVSAALEAGTPALGICYGGQLLAHALGGSVQRAEIAEFGWHKVESADPVLCPPGPWAQFHGDSLRPAPTSRVLGTSVAGCQAYVDDTRPARVIGWQFHPEVGGARFAEWVDELEEFCRVWGADPEALRREAQRQGDHGRAPAYELTDAALAYLLRKAP